MNIFVLDRCPVTAARSQCDKHVVKMTLETAQILSSAIWRRGGRGLYRVTHRNHPCTLWAGDSYSNFQWLCMHGLALADEFTLRNNKQHASARVIAASIALGDELLRAGEFPDVGPTPHPLCMPDRYKTGCPVQSYRAFYIGEKARFARWKIDNAPTWWTAT